MYIIAGPNGAGKTTFAREFLPNYVDCRNFINADSIAQGMSPFSPEEAAFRAGRLMLGEIELYARRGESFGNRGATPAVIAFEKWGSLRIMSRDVYDTLFTRYGTPLRSHPQTSSICRWKSAPRWRSKLLSRRWLWDTLAEAIPSTFGAMAE